MNVISSLFSFIGNLIGSTTMGTTATTITGAIAEHESDISDIMSDISITVISMSDCNDATDPRKIYSFNTSTTNKPGSVNYGFLRCFGVNSNYCCQMAMPMNTVNAKLFIRSKASSGWGSWIQL